MPSLTAADRALLLTEMNWECKTCKQVVRRNYCRECDAFFFVCACPVKPDPPGTVMYKQDHTGHRTY